jgi:hypothetical protein
VSRTFLMQMYQHIGFSLRKEILVRHLLSWSIASESPRSHLLERFATQHNALMANLQVAIESRLQDDQPLDIFLAKCLDDLERLTRGTGDADLDHLISAVLTEFNRKRQLVSCDNCAKACNAGSACGGVDPASDEAVAVEQGRCLDFLKELYNLSCMTARQAYAKVSETATSSVAVSFGTVAQRGPTHELVHGGDVNGITQFRDEAAGRHSIVSVILNANAGTLDSYTTAFYVLLHECVCHAYQSCLAAGPRVHADPDDPFAEGWMDYVTFLIVNRMEDDPSVEEGVEYPTRPRYWKDMVTQGQAFHRARCDTSGVYSVQETLKYARQRSYGMHVARDRVLYAIEGLMVDDPQASLISLSVDLNIKLASTPDRRALVVSLADMLPARGTTRGGARSALFYRSYRKYMLDQDLWLFLRNLGV